jgi:predicted transcriptional regulator
MPPPANEELAQLQRRKRVAELYLAGLTQWETAEKLGVVQSTVSKDLAVIRGEWLASALQDFDARKAEELAKVDRLERVALDAWERSCRDAVSVATTTGRTDKEGAPLPDQVTTTVKGQAGDPRFLERVAWCVNKRCEILGLDSPKRLSPVNPDGTPFKVYVGGFDPMEVLGPGVRGEPCSPPRPPTT